MNEGTKPKVAPVAVVEHDDLPIVEWSAVDQDRGTVLELEQGGPAAVLLVVGFAARTILQDLYHYRGGFSPSRVHFTLVTTAAEMSLGRRRWLS